MVLGILKSFGGIDSILMDILATIDAILMEMVIHNRVRIRSNPIR
jgi:hypothetical protein